MMFRSNPGPDAPSRRRLIARVPKALRVTQSSKIAVPGLISRSRPQPNEKIAAHPIN
jgi:hypothetical protein